MYKIRRAERENDLNYLIDIDTKSFEFAWFSERWEQVLVNNVVLVNTHWSTPVGFVVLRFHETYAQIVKFAVKPNHRKRGLASNLIDAAYRCTALKRCRQVQCMVPEPWLFADDQPSPLSRFLKRNQLIAKPPFIRNAFTFGGETMDGVRFVYPD